MPLRRLPRRRRLRRRDRPKGTSGPCWGSGKEECFFKRHAWSWKIACSECWKDTECPACDEDLGGPDAKHKEALERQLEIEGSRPKRPLYVGFSPHFYLVTDLHRQVKVLTEGGAPRLMSGHEFVHLYLQRCEQAYEDFVHWFDKRVNLGKPMGVFLVKSKSDKEAIGAKYFGNPKTSQLYGGGSNRIAAASRGTGSSGRRRRSATTATSTATCATWSGTSCSRAGSSCPATKSSARPGRTRPRPTSSRSSSPSTTTTRTTARRRRRRPPGARRTGTRRRARWPRGAWTRSRRTSAATRSARSSTRTTCAAGRCWTSASARTANAG